MAINVTVRDIVNFPGGTPKTITLDITQIVPAGGSPEGDEIWVSSATTTATASGGGAIEDIFKNEMKRGFLRGTPPSSTLLDVGASAFFKLALDENISGGVDVGVTQGNNLLTNDVAQDIENNIRALAAIGQGGAKEGNLSYLNAQVRFVNGVFSIESGTVTDRFTGSGRSSVAIDAPILGNDVRSTLGLNLVVSSESLAARQLAETALAVAYSAGDIISVNSVAGFSSGEVLEVRDENNSQVVLISGAGVADDLAVSEIRFVSVSGTSLGLANSYNTGSQVRKFHPIDTPDPVSAVVTMDQLYRFQIDSMVNQVDFSS